MDSLEAFFADNPRVVMAGVFFLAVFLLERLVFVFTEGRDIEVRARADRRAEPVERVETAQVASLAELLGGPEAPTRVGFLATLRELYRGALVGPGKGLRALERVRVEAFLRQGEERRVRASITAVIEGSGEGPDRLQRRHDDLVLVCAAPGGPWTVEALRNVSEAPLPPRRVEAPSLDALPPSLYQEDLPAALARFRDDIPGFSLLALGERLRAAFLALQEARTRGQTAPLQEFFQPDILAREGFWIERDQGLGHVRHVDEVQLLRMDLVRVEGPPHPHGLTFHVVASLRDETVDAQGQVVAGRRGEARVTSEYWTLVRGPGPAGADEDARVDWIEGEEEFRAWDRRMRTLPGTGAPVPTNRVDVLDRAAPMEVYAYGSKSPAHAHDKQMAAFERSRDAQLVQLEEEAAQHMMALAAQAQARPARPPLHLDELRAADPDLSHLGFLESVERRFTDELAGTHPEVPASPMEVLGARYAACATGAEGDRLTVSLLARDLTPESAGAVRAYRLELSRPASARGSPVAWNLDAVHRGADDDAPLPRLPAPEGGPAYPPLYVAPDLEDQRRRLLEARPSWSWVALEERVRKLLEARARARQEASPTALEGLVRPRLVPWLTAVLGAGSDPGLEAWVPDMPLQRIELARVEGGTSGVTVSLRLGLGLPWDAEGHLAEYWTLAMEEGGQLGMLEAAGDHVG